MKVNLVAYRFKNLHNKWGLMYRNVIQSLKELGADIRVSPHITFTNPPKDVKVGIVDNKDDIYIYNHTYPEEIEGRFFKGKKSIFLKPTGPTDRHYSIDPLGFGSRITISYEKPDFEGVQYEKYWEKEIIKIKENKSRKWGAYEYQFFDSKTFIPNNHILIIGQMPGDVSVREFSFNNHLEDIDRIIYKLDKKDPVVIKLHPFLKDRSSPTYWDKIEKKIERWKKLGHTVIYGMEDIHNILPKTKLAILENSTAGIECMVHDTPMITFGCPEYRWICKELRQIVDLNKYKNDLSWFNKELSRKFLVWYVRDWLCYDVESTKRRLKEVLF